jgi:hypothetical protein
MGRWAEVYFTAPPEKREQAVLELLRELQGEDSRREDATVTSPSSVREQAQASELVVAPASQMAEAEQILVRCQSCGRENPASHRFCGMCGKPVAEQGTAADLHIEDPPQDEFPRLGHHNEPQFVPDEDAVYQPRLRTNELSLFQSGRGIDYRDDSTEEIFHYPPASRSYRVYVGIALAIVMSALAYMAWRSTQASSQSAHVEPQAPPTVAMQPAAPEPTPPSVSKTDVPERTPPANQQAAIPHTNPAGAKLPGHKAAKAAPPSPPTTERNPQTEAAAGNGTEELAAAQSYLNGADGQRNRAEAAKWLWKSVAKHNAEATLLLADLYLKGQGVGKNCDQARVLLDAAARKGMKDAGQRLRHLQAFGCE